MVLGVPDIFWFQVFKILRFSWCQSSRASEFLGFKFDGFGVSGFLLTEYQDLSV